MYYYIPQAIIVLAGLGLGYVFYKKIPVILQLPKEPETILPKERLHKKVATVTKDIFLAARHKLWGPALLSWLEKRLRELRIGFMKLDNMIISIINRSHDKSQTWKVRTKAWGEQRRVQKMEKLKVMEKLDKVEFLEMLGESQSESQEEDSKTAKAGEDQDEEKSEKMTQLQEEKELINRIAKNPKDKEAYLSLGRFYLERDDLEDAEASFVQVLKLEEDNQEARKLLEEVEGRKSKATKS